MSLETLLTALFFSKCSEILCHASCTELQSMEAGTGIFTHRVVMGNVGLSCPGLAVGRAGSSWLSTSLSWFLLELGPWSSQLLCCSASWRLSKGTGDGVLMVGCLPSACRTQWTQMLSNRLPCFDCVHILTILLNICECTSMQVVHFVSN